jgi:outer membrane scaffolding protein for murein synthesis (MipA/OmpV family)
MPAVRGSRRRAPYLSPFRRGGRLGTLAAVLLCAMAIGPRPAFSQTPAPLQEWQYSAGIVLVRMFEPNLPDWRVQVGLAAEPRPAYEGARHYRTLAGPVIDVRYRDIYFASVGEGIGVNLVRGENYRAGIAVGYDLGRRESDDLNHLKGLGNIQVAPVLKVFGSYVVSKDFPLVLRADVRRYVGGADGWVGDVEAYLPLPGSSKKFVMFAGPSVTFADRRHMQTTFGVNDSQALASGYPVFAAHGGMNAAGFGFTATWIISTRWLLNTNIAVNRLLGGARDSPITHEPPKSTVPGLALTGGALALSVVYSW